MVSVSLTDTSGKDDVHINDVLVKENHAKYSVRLNCHYRAHTAEFNSCSL